MSAPSRTSRRTPPQLWVSSTYFAEGFPYSLVNKVVDALFLDLGASLRTIGLTSLFHIPWNLKFLWGPFVDQYETKRRWLVGVEVALSSVIVALALFVGTFQAITTGLIVAIFLCAFLSATHDIAIDGFYLEALDEQEQAAYVGWRAWFYRIAGLLLGGPLFWLVDRTGWFVGLLVVAAMMIALTLYHAAVLPRVETRGQSARDMLKSLGRPRVVLLAGVVGSAIVADRQLGVVEGLSRALRFREWPVLGGLSFSQWVVLGLLVMMVAGVLFGRRQMKAAARGDSSPYVQSLSSFMQQPSAGLLLAFVVLFRTGESFLSKMQWPFLNMAVGMDKSTYGIVNGMLGVAASGGATLLGGWLIAKYGLRRCIWPFVVAQNGLNLLYMWLGLADDPAALPTWAVNTVIALEHAGAGLGTAVFMVYLMRCCDPAHKAGHMAILTALMSVSFTIAGVASGFLAEEIGFAGYFGFTFAATIPSMLLIPFLPYLDGRTPEPPPQS